ncbi:alpha/beta hydrolase [Planctomycetes bacterium K23_9]|uniref:Alpha/beta hydrolase family protein n=1 Tax=Stieleria marina TaxID=1930275 RepID=A0A517NVA9_9BACT|nr:Alpha/beta hydrolase family protein [Planctomycetes bacterium K23_9]
MTEITADESKDKAAASVSPPNRIVSLAKTVLRIGLLAYAIVIILMVTFESRLVYPGAYMDVPQRTESGVIEVHYSSSDGTPLKGYLYEAPADESDGNRPTVLYFHGNGITAAYESTFIANLGRQLGANVMAAEYRGFDSLEGSPHESGVIADAMAARDFLCDRYNIEPDTLTLYGQSLGGGCAVAVAADSGAGLLVLDRTFDRMVDVAADRYWFIPVGLLMQNRYDSIERVQHYAGPLIQVHGTTDRLIPIHHGRRLHDSAPSQRKKLFEVAGMGHNDAMPPSARDALIDQIKAWID